MLPADSFVSAIVWRQGVTEEACKEKHKVSQDSCAGLANGLGKHASSFQLLLIVAPAITAPVATAFAVVMQMANKQFIISSGLKLVSIMSFSEINLNKIMP